MLERRMLRSLALTIAVGLGAGLTACSAWESPEPTPSESPSASPAEPADPESAAGRQAAFEGALEDSWSEERPVDRQRTIDALVEAGFDTESMQVTSDVDSLGGTVANIEVAIRIGDDCLIGQIGEDGTRSMVTTPLSGGRCLIGDTPPID